MTTGFIKDPLERFVFEDTSKGSLEMESFVWVEFLAAAIGTDPRRMEFFVL